MTIQLSNNTRKSSDLDRIANLAFECFKNTCRYKNPNDVKWLIGELQHDLNHKLIVAYDSETFVGFSAYGLINCFEEPSYKQSAIKQGIEYKPNRITISMLAVIPEQRKKGIGKQLIEKVMENSKKSGVQQIYVTCWMGGKKESYHLFKSLGYKDLEATMSYPDGSQGAIMVKEP